MVTPLHDNQYQLGDFHWNAIDDDGVAWFVTRDEDWWRGSSRRITQLDRPFGNGYCRSRSWAGARVLTFEVMMRAPTRAIRDAVMDALAAVCGDGDTVPLIGPGRDGQYRLDVEYTDPPDPVSINPREVRFQWILVAQDPLKRSVTEYTTGQIELPSTSGGLTFPAEFPTTFGATVTSGSAQILNGGRAEIGLILRIDGPAANPRINLVRGTDVRTIRCNLTVEAGQWLTIDTAARTVMLNDVASRRGLTAFLGDFTVPPGTSEISWDCDVYQPTAHLTATWHYARY